MNKILIIGATSAIAEHAAREWARRGDALFLVARNPARTAAIAADLKVRGAPSVATHTLDLLQVEGYEAMLAACEEALGGAPDIALIAHGTLSDQAACQQSVALTLKEFNANALSVVALCTLIANRFETRGSGVLAVISSVAGDRGRASNYVYGSAKALVTAFTSGLRQRLSKKGVTVLTIKPGFVDTPMTAAFKKGPAWASAASVGQQIVRAIDARRGVLYTPFFWRPIMAVIRAIPEFLFAKLSL